MYRKVCCKVCARVCVCVRSSVCACVRARFAKICQVFYEERLEGDYRETRFLELARKEGAGVAKVERALQQGKVPTFSPLT